MAFARLRSFALTTFVTLAAVPAAAMPPRAVTGVAGGEVVNVKVRRITEVKPTSTTAPPPSIALKGKQRVLVILVDTEDSPWPSDQPKSRYEDLVFGGSGQTMAVYYRENSYGLLDLDGEVVGPIRLPGRMEDYAYLQQAPDSTRVKKLIERALQGAAKKVKLAKYDTHDIHGKAGKDGVLDHLMVLYAEKTGKHDGFAPIWPHRGSLDLKVGGIRVASYTILNHAAHLGVYVHEFGHDIGIPDLYDRDYTSHGAGDWCTMASGSWAGGAERPVHISAWGKIRVGWITPALVAKPVQNLRVPSSSEHPFALKIPIGEVDSPEYFLVENRRKVGFDAEIPAEGLVVWHIDETRGSNDDESHKMVDVEEAERDQDLDRIDQMKAPSYEGDVFEGRSRSVFDDDSTPSARSYDGSSSGIKMRVLSPPEPVMSVDVHRPEIFNPGGIPYMLSLDNYTFGRFAAVPLGLGSEVLVQLDATPGGYLVFGTELFFAGSPNARGEVTLRIYGDKKGKPGTVRLEKAVEVALGPEGYAWVKARLGKGAEGVRLKSEETVWVGVTTDQGEVWPAMNPFSTSKRARFRMQKKQEIEKTFRFADRGVVPVDDYVVRLTGFGYLEGSEHPEPRANDADELVVRLNEIDKLADDKKYEAALKGYEDLLKKMEESPRRYEGWIPVVINSAGVMAYELKRYEPAIERFESSLRRAKAAGDDANTADIYENLGETFFFAGKFEEAKVHCDRSRELNKKLNRYDRLVENHYWLGRAHQELKDEKASGRAFEAAQAEVARAFPKDAGAEAEWKARIARALEGNPEDKPSVDERSKEMKEKSAKKKQTAVYTDLFQFLNEDTGE